MQKPCPLQMSKFVVEESAVSLAPSLHRVFSLNKSSIKESKHYNISVDFFLLRSEKQLKNLFHRSFLCRIPDNVRVPLGIQDCMQISQFSKPFAVRKANSFMAPCVDHGPFQQMHEGVVLNWQALAPIICRSKTERRKGRGK